MKNVKEIKKAQAILESFLGLSVAAKKIVLLEGGHKDGEIDMLLFSIANRRNVEYFWKFGYCEIRVKESDNAYGCTLITKMV